MSEPRSERDDPQDPKLPLGVRLPLNLKRLIAVHLRAIAKAMDLSTIGQVKQVIESR